MRDKLTELCESAAALLAAALHLLASKVLRAGGKLLVLAEKVRAARIENESS
jgi:hypothetical protein